MRRLSLMVMLAVWLLMTPHGPILHDGTPVQFATLAECVDIATWLNGQVDRTWYWCQQR